MLRFCLLVFIESYSPYKIPLFVLAESLVYSVIMILLLIIFLITKVAYFWKKATLLNPTEFEFGKKKPKINITGFGLPSWLFYNDSLQLSLRICRGQIGVFSHTSLKFSGQDGAGNVMSVHSQHSIVGHRASWRFRASRIVLLANRGSFTVCCLTATNWIWTRKCTCIFSKRFHIN